jgi:glutamate formiminotransferase / 5-formyltetrahydrofolate cyclo-ligase
VALIECVPNVSEGRRAEVIERLADAVRAIRDVRLLDLSADAAHNRAVITLVGPAAPLRDAVLALFAVAVPAIDLRTHTGEHPRLGAVDVVPFIPIANVSMADCVALARETAAAVADRFQVPVFLYEEAATTPARRNLADIRRGEFEGLAPRMRLPEWTPDFGPRAPHPSAGATAIGARMPLIAFNVNLATDRLDIARKIAATVRESSGGLPFVKALGLPLAERGLVQVSMNLTNHQATPIWRAFDAVAHAAKAHGVGVLESELIGMVPRSAVPPDVLARIRIARFSEQQILEERINPKRL